VQESEHVSHSHLRDDKQQVKGRFKAKQEAVSDPEQLTQGIYHKALSG